MYKLRLVGYVMMLKYACNRHVAVPEGWGQAELGMTFVWTCLCNASVLRPGSGI